MFRKAVSSILTSLSTKPGSGGLEADRAEAPAKSKPSSPQASANANVNVKPPKLPPRPPTKTSSSLPSDAVASSAAAVDDSVASVHLGDDDAVPRRSVKISFPKGHDKNVLSEDQVAIAAQQFGTVSRILMTERNCLILFTKAVEAMNFSCASFDSLQSVLPPLGYPITKLRIKYMGNTIPSLDDSFASNQSVDRSMLIHQSTEIGQINGSGQLGIGPTFVVGPTKMYDLEIDATETNNIDIDANPSYLPALPAGNVSHMPRSESNLSLQSDLASVSTDHVAKDETAEEPVSSWNSGRESWKNANANSAVTTVQVPHYNHVASTQTLRSIETDEELELETAITKASTSQPPIALMKKASREIQVGSPNSPKLKIDDAANAQANKLVHPSQCEDSQEQINFYEVNNDDNIGDESFDLGACKEERNAPVRVSIPDEVKSTSSEEAEEATEDGEDFSLSTDTASFKEFQTATFEMNRVISSAPPPLPPRPLEKKEKEDLKTGSKTKDQRGYDKLKERHTEVLHRVRVLEAEAKVHHRQRVEFTSELQRTEEAWSRELTELSIRNSELETECTSLKELNRKAKIELSRMGGELSAANAAKDAAEALLDGSDARAERDALSTVLAHQRLIGILEKQKDAAVNSAKQFKDEVLQLREFHKQAVAEAIEWKSKALYCSPGSKFIRKSDGASAVSESKSEIKDDSVLPDENAKLEMPESIDDAADDVFERSSRIAVKEEMAKYLKLLNVPDAASYASSPTFLVEEHNPRQSFVLAEARARTTSERIALDLAESRKKLEAMRKSGYIIVR